LGLERAGMRCVGQVEKDEYCLAVLEHHWPAVKRIADIYDVTESDFGAVELICGGFPCQPFSFAGKKRGQKDDRYLWPEMLRVIKAYRPTWVLGENVAGIVGVELDKVLADLENEGYELQAFIIPACAVDAPHERKRVWIVARRWSSHVDDSESGRRGILHTENIGPTSGEINASCHASEVMAHGNGQGCGERRRPEPVQPEQHSAQCSGQNVPYAVNDGHNRTEGNATEQGRDESDNGIFERGHTWEPEPDVGRMADGIPNRVAQLRALGNAVVPQVVEEIGRCIIEAERTGTICAGRAAAEHCGRFRNSKQQPQAKTGEVGFGM